MASAMLVRGASASTVTRPGRRAQRSTRNAAAGVACAEPCAPQALQALASSPAPGPHDMEDVAPCADACHSPSTCLTLMFHRLTASYAVLGA